MFSNHFIKSIKYWVIHNYYVCVPLILCYCKIEVEILWSSHGQPVPLLIYTWRGDLFYYKMRRFCFLPQMRVLDSMRTNFFIGSWWIRRYTTPGKAEKIRKFWQLTRRLQVTLSWCDPQHQLFTWTFLQCPAQRSLWAIQLRFCKSGLYFNKVAQACCKGLFLRVFIFSFALLCPCRDRTGEWLWVV